MAGAFPVPALTAEQVIVDTLAVVEGERLLVHGAAGVTGRLVVGRGAVAGAEVIATASPPQHDKLRSLGASHVFDYHDADWPEQVRSLTGGTGVDAAANAAGGAAAAALECSPRRRPAGDDHRRSTASPARDHDLGPVRAT